MNQRLKKILLWTFVGLLALGQFQRIELEGNYSGINIYFHDIFISFWLISFLFTINLKFLKLKTFFKDALSKYKTESIFTGIVILGIVTNVLLNSDLVSLLYVARFSSYILFCISLKYLVKQNFIKSSELRFMFFGAGIIILFLGVIQLLTIKDTRFLAILGWDDHLNRLISTIFDPGFTGLILVITLMYLYSLKKLINNKLISELLSFLLLLGIALTFSRASYLATIIALLSLAIIKRKLLTPLILKAFVFIAIVLMIPKPGGEGVNLSRTSSITARKSTLQYEISLITPKTLLIGNGLFSEQNSLEKHPFIPSHSRVPDNFLINLLLSTGVIGTAMAIIILIKWSTKIFKQDPELGAAIFATLIHTQFGNSIFQPFVLLMLLGGIASLKQKV